MPQIKLSARAVADLTRLYQFLVVKDKDAAGRAMLTIQQSFLPLTRFPMIGRPADDNTDLHELVIDFGVSGYLALYRFEANLDIVTILAIKQQREDDYK
jgi:plasmid stabilization system protein ParE